MVGLGDASACRTTLSRSGVFVQFPEPRWRTSEGIAVWSSPRHPVVGQAKGRTCRGSEQAKGQAPSGSASANLGRHGASGVCRRRSRRSSLSLSSAKKSGESLNPRLWTAKGS
jgi:hypothetical protein